MSDTKWSNDADFPEGGECQIGDKLVGLRDGDNFKCDFPSDGIKDSNENYLIKWATTGGSASNFLEFTNGQGGIPTKITAAGADSDICLDINFFFFVFLDIGGLFTVNGSTSINSIINDSSMASASTTNVPTSKSVVDYIAAAPGAAGGSNTQIQYNNAGALGGDVGFTTTGAGSITVTGDLSVDNINVNGNTISSTDTDGNINITPDGTGSVLMAGAYTINSTILIDAIIDDDTMATATATNLPTSESVVAYVASIPSSAGGSNTQLQYNNAGALGGDSGFTTDGSGSLTVTGDLSVDNININANTISSTDTDGDINLTPDGTGSVVLDGVDWSGLTDGQLFIGNTGTVPTGATLTSGGGVSLQNGAGSITISGAGSGYAWTEVTGTSQSMAVNNAYIANNAALVTLTLPATAAVGDTVLVQGKGAGGWRIGQNAGQTIFGSTPTSNMQTTTGAGGFLDFDLSYNGIELVCITANTDWAIVAVRVQDLSFT